MAQISFTIPDNKLTEVLDRFCLDYGYQDFIYNITTGLYDTPNPESKSNFARRLVKDFFIQPYIRHHKDLAALAAGITANSEV